MMMSAETILMYTVVKDVNVPGHEHGEIRTKSNAVEDFIGRELGVRPF